LDARIHCNHPSQGQVTSPSSPQDKKSRSFASRIKQWSKQTPVEPDRRVAGVVETLIDEPDEAKAVHLLSSLDELTEKLSEIEAAAAISDDAAREVFQGFAMAPPSDIPADPYSAEYADRQFEFYRRIADRSTYEIDNERSDFPTDANCPFPYYTKSSETVGHQLMAIGFIIKTMGLPAGSSILDLGPGWGNTTIELARMGYEVTAIDIDPTFVKLIEERADKFALTVDVRRGGFLEIDQLNRTFDAVLFFESFHHCSDHRELVRKLKAVVAPGGRAFFAAEPVADTFPMPWGIRTDGESLWAIRQFGWLELGYQESYFLRMLAHLGWIVKKHVTVDTHLGIIFEALRADGVYEMSTFVLPPDEDATWGIPDGPDIHHRYTTGRSVISLEQGRDCTSIVIDAVNACPNAIPYRVIHGAEELTAVAPPHQEFSIQIPYDPLAGSLVMEATEWRPADVMDSIDTRLLGLAVRTITLH
jgi:2-polyprenyl-3-methyl-5-hydroxy-6-metoxy-1,4-benzoquinol methylase